MTQLTEELPEHRYYHLLKNGETEPTGPYSQSQLFQLFETEQIRTTDYVYFGEWDGWKRFSQVFDVQDHVISHFVGANRIPMSSRKSIFSW